MTVDWLKCEVLFINKSKINNVLNSILPVERIDQYNPSKLPKCHSHKGLTKHVMTLATLGQMHQITVLITLQYKGFSGSVIRVPT